MTDPVLYELKGQAAWITLNRPENHNALGPLLTRALDAALERALADERARVIVLAAAGRTFCSGLDLKGGGEPCIGNEDCRSGQCDAAKCTPEELPGDCN